MPVALNQIFKSTLIHKQAHFITPKQIQSHRHKLDVWNKNSPYHFIMVSNICTCMCEKHREA